MKGENERKEAEKEEGTTGFDGRMAGGKVVGELGPGSKKKGGGKRREREALRVPAVITRPFP